VVEKTQRCNVRHASTSVRLPFVRPLFGRGTSRSVSAITFRERNTPGTTSDPVQLIHRGAPAAGEVVVGSIASMPVRYSLGPYLARQQHHNPDHPRYATSGVVLSTSAMPQTWTTAGGRENCCRGNQDPESIKFLTQRIFSASGRGGRCRCRELESLDRHVSTSRTNPSRILAASAVRYSTIQSRTSAAR